MALHKISKGLDLPISGDPEQKISGEPKIKRVAIVADDYPGMKPRMFVKEGDTVQRGQAVFENRKQAGVLFTAPGAGKVVAINRGKRRALQSLVIELNDNEVKGQPSAEDHAKFERFTGRDVASLSRDDIVGLLVESGLWTSLRARPFSKIPSPTAEPNALFVNAAETNPLAPNPDVVVAAESAAFELGLKVVSQLTSGTTFLCVNGGSKIDAGGAQVQREEFAGPHPAGTVGVHIHTLYPVSRARTVWHLAYQDVIAIGKLFETGKLDVTRVVAVAGPPVKQGGLVKTRLGASIGDIMNGELVGDEGIRFISGSVLSGKKAVGEIFGFLGRYDQQVSVLKEGNQRDLLGWLAPGAETYSTIPLFISKLFGGKKFDFTTATNGSPRAMVPLGMYERVMPMDILPTFLLRALTVGDVERAEQLGALELDEEDLALCTFVCPGKTNYGLLLRKNLQTIEEEG